MALRLGVSALLALAFAGAFVMALDFPPRSARYPLAISAFGVLISALNLATDAAAVLRGTAQKGAGLPAGGLRTLSLLLLVLPSVALFGVLGAAALWLPAFLILAAGMRWPFALLDGAVVCAAFLLVEATDLGALPRGLLF
jgi:hypothetical protein